MKIICLLLSASLLFSNVLKASSDAKDVVVNINQTK